MAASTSVHAVLNKHTTDRYKIEYGGFLSNHIAHGIIALDRLGASDERVKRFVQWYKTRLELPTSEEKTENLSLEKIQSILGKEESFYAILGYYQNLLASRHGGSVDSLIVEEFPKLSSGMAGAAFHGGIKLGYGYAVNHERTILEGLAYLHSSYRPILSKTSDTWYKDIGQGETNIIDILNSIAKDDSLRRDMLQAEKYWIRNNKPTSSFQTRTDYLLTEKGDVLIDYAKTIKLPDTVYENGKLNSYKLGKQILEWVVTVYTISQTKNDFFLLHGVTCTWALCQILPILREEDALKMLAELLVGIEAVYLAQNSPGLANTPPNVSEQSWDDIIEKTLSSDWDEHIFKLVQWYGAKLEHPTDGEKAEVIKPDKIHETLGNEVSFYAILKHYTDLLKNRYNNSLDSLIAGELPKLSSGIIGAAFHGIIHTGYGYSAKNERTVLEGLAYSHFAYRPILPKANVEWQKDLGKGEQDILTVLNAIRNDQGLIDNMLEGVKRDTRDPKVFNYFQKRTDYLLAERADVLIDHAKTVKFPDTVFVSGDIDIIELGRQVLEWAVILFTKSERRNDFILLHGVTSTWSLCQVLPILKTEDAVKVLMEILVGLEAAYLAQDYPKLTQKLDTNLEVTHEAWSKLIKEALNGDRDEHVYKLIHICYELSQEYRHSRSIYLEAASICLNNEFSFLSELL